MSGYQHISEGSLLQRLKKGDAAAFEEIYNRYWEKLLAIGLFYTHSKQAAEDVVHEVMISLWKRRNEVVIQAIEPYLATAVKFAVFKAIAREKKKRDALSKREIPKAVADVEEKLEARFLEEYLKNAVQQLPEQARLVFTYRRYDALTVAEIAGKMDLSPKAVEYHLTKAIKALREAVKKIKMFFI